MSATIKKRKILHAHDRSFKAALSDPRVAMDFFDHHLPANIKSQLDLSTIKTEKDTYVDEELRLLVTDILFSVQYKDQSRKDRCYLYLLTEHLYEPDRLVPWRNLKYVCRIIEDDLKKTQSETLPIVITLVVYNGKIKYPFSTDIFDLFGENAAFAKENMFTKFHLVDFSEIPDEEMRSRKWSGLMEMLMKHIHDDIMDYLESLVKMIHFLAYAEADTYILGMLKYVIEKSNLTDRERFRKFLQISLPEPLENQAMTLAQQFIEEGRQKALHETKTLAQQFMEEGRQKALHETKTLAQQFVEEGRQKGRQEGRQEGWSDGIHQTLAVLDLLQAGMSITEISKTTGMGQPEILEIKKHLNY